MKLYNLKKAFPLFLLCILAFPVSAQVKLKPEQMKEDLRYLKDRLQLLHPGLYRYNDSLKYEEHFQQLNLDFEKETDFKDFFTGMAPMITDIKDLHTSFDFPKNKYGKNPKVFPLIVRRFGDRFFVHLNGSSDTTIIRTSEIVRINQEPVIDIYKKLQTLYGTDNGNETSKEYYAEKAFASYYLRYYGMPDSVSVSYRLPANDTIFVRKIAMETNKILLKTLSERYKNALRKNFDFVILDSLNKVARLDISSFTLKGKYFDLTQSRFKKELRKRFVAIEKTGIKHLIIDLRGNGGGYIPNISRLMKYISPEPFKLIDTMMFRRKAFNKLFPFYTIGPPIVASFLFRKLDSRHRYLVNRNPKKHKPYKENHFDGKLYFLMDGGSYSATTFTLGLAYDMNLGTFIGTRPGGANWGSFAGEWDNFKLPNSRIKIHMPLYKIVHAQPKGRIKGFFIEPDYYVGYGFNDFLKREDTVLKFTVNMIRASNL